MARGKKFNDDIKEKALAMLATNNNITEIARELEIHESTLRTWRDNQKDDEFTNLRKEKKKEFIDGAWDIITKARKLLERRISRALENESELDNIISQLKEPLTEEQKKALYGKISKLKLEDVGKLSTVLGTLYDKQALASNDPTVNLGGATLEELVKKVEGKSDY